MIFEILFSAKKVSIEVDNILFAHICVNHLNTLLFEIVDFP